MIADTNTAATLFILLAALGGYGIGWLQRREWARRVALKTTENLMRPAWHEAHRLGFDNGFRFAAALERDRDAWRRKHRKVWRFSTLRYRHPRYAEEEEQPAGTLQTA